MSNNIIMNHMQELHQREQREFDPWADHEAEGTNEPEELEIEEESGIECYNCGCCIEYGTEVEYDDEYYCTDCVSTCDYCARSIPYDDLVISNIHLPYANEHTACPDCAEDNFVRCDHCDAWISHSGIWASDENRAICQRCSDHYYTCDDCGEIIHVDNGYHADGYTYCEYCYNENHRRSDNISSYGHDQFSASYDRHRFHQMPDEEDVERFFGVEIEVDGGFNQSSLADDLFDEVEDSYEMFKCKNDGSLSDEGLEIVTYPCSYRYMLEEYPFDDIANICIRNGYRSHDTSSCGMHIHVSRNGMGKNVIEQDLTVAKLVILFDRFWEELVRFSRRDYSRLEQWAKKPDVDIDDDDDDNDIIVKATESRDRYQAINLNNRQTVEFRLFRGTLKVSTIKASIQLLDYMIDYVMARTLKECMKTTWSDLVGCANYEELQSYLADRGF